MNDANSRRGFLIAFEGGDRCGKTTQVAALCEKLKRENPSAEVVQLKHPDRTTVIGNIINDYLNKKIELDNNTILLVLTASLWETG